MNPGLCLSFLTALLTLGVQPAARAQPTFPAGNPPNVLFIAIDDLNDWVGPLGGHPLVQTLDALETADLADNTVVVLWSDHGYHLGEKAITGKNTLWERSTRVPLIFAGPGIARGTHTTRPAELLDLYPTLVELCGLPPRTDLEGLSLVPQLTDPDAPRELPAITSHNRGNHGIRSERWRYIRYADHSASTTSIRVSGCTDTVV
jgi:hypothetical protein